jgi:hypothetical protein
LGRYRAALGIEYGAKATVGLYYAELHTGDIQDIFFPQLFRQLIYGESVFAHFGLDYPSVFNNNAGLSAQKASNVYAF